MPIFYIYATKVVQYTNAGKSIYEFTIILNVFINHRNVLSWTISRTLCLISSTCNLMQIRKNSWTHLSTKCALNCSIFSSICLYCVFLRRWKRYKRVYTDCFLDIRHKIIQTTLDKSRTIGVSYELKKSITSSINRFNVVARPYKLMWIS